MGIHIYQTVRLLGMGGWQIWQQKPEMGQQRDISLGWAFMRPLCRWWHAWQPASAPLGCLSSRCSCSSLAFCSCRPVRSGYRTAEHSRGREELDFQVKGREISGEPARSSIFFKLDDQTTERQPNLPRLDDQTRTGELNTYLLEDQIRERFLILIV